MGFLIIKAYAFPQLIDSVFDEIIRFNGQLLKKMVEISE